VSKTIDIVVLGLSLTSSWGNGHATTYRSLIKGLAKGGRRVLFLEREQPWYAAHRDLRASPYCETRLYSSIEELEGIYTPRIRLADAVIVGSFVPDGTHVCRWVLDEARGIRAFYDIDTPVTLSYLNSNNCPYLDARQISEFDLFLSFTGGATLTRLETEFGAQRALPLYCSVDVDEYRPIEVAKSIDLGYMGTYSDDRQSKLEDLLLEPARRLPSQKFMVAGALYPPSVQWPKNVLHKEHLGPGDHPDFYGSQRFTLNLTRADMVDAGYSPSVRLFEAAACGVPIISDQWTGLETFFTPHQEVFLAHTPEDVVRCLQDLDESQARAVGAAARERVLAAHSGVHRAAELETYFSLVTSRPMPTPQRIGGTHAQQATRRAMT